MLTVAEYPALTEEAIMLAIREPTMHELMHELTDTELDAVSGGLFDFGNTVVQANAAQQTGFNLLNVGGGVAQTLIQANLSFI
jgi:bacteriocin-like protein